MTAFPNAEPASSDVSKLAGTRVELMGSVVARTAGGEGFGLPSATNNVLEMWWLLQTHRFFRCVRLCNRGLMPPVHHQLNEG
jgi:hypothetical protein